MTTCYLHGDRLAVQVEPTIAPNQSNTSRERGPSRLVNRRPNTKGRPHDSSVVVDLRNNLQLVDALEIVDRIAVDRGRSGLRRLVADPLRKFWPTRQTYFVPDATPRLGDHT